MCSVKILIIKYTRNTKYDKNRSMLSILSIYRGTTNSDRGTSIRVRSIIRELSLRNDVTLFTASWDSQLQIDARKHTQLNNSHLRELFSLIKYIKSKNIDIVLGHTISSAYYLLPIKIFTRARVVLEMHGFLEEEEYLYGNIGRISYLIKKKLHSFFYVFFDLVTTCSDSATNYIKKYNNNTKTVYGGFDEKLFNQRYRSQENNKKIIIGYAGNARIWQGLNFLLEALYSVSNKNFELRILCSEKKWKLDEKYYYFAKLCAPLLHKEVPKFLVECDILVIPRLKNMVNELSFPSKLMEYLAMGKPVIASKTSDCHRIIHHGVDGLLYDPGDKKDFIKKLELLWDSDYRKEIGENALKKVSNFTWSKQVDIIVDNIKNICQNRTGKKIL